MANSATLRVEGSDKLDAMLAQLVMLVVAGGGPLDKAVRKAANIVTTRARQLAPDSAKTGSRDKQSKKSKQIWTGKLKRLIRSKVIKYERSSWAVVGPKSREGNMSHFQQEKPRRMVLWGKSTMVAQYRIERNWITQAFDETKNEQVAAMEASIKADIDAIARAK